jgi:hypothetical protein
MPIPPSLDVNLTSEQSIHNGKITAWTNSFGNHKKNIKNINNIEINPIFPIKFQELST